MGVTGSDVSQQYSPVDTVPSQPGVGSNVRASVAGKDSGQANSKPPHQTGPSSLQTLRRCYGDVKPLQRLPERPPCPTNVHFEFNTAEISSTHHVPNYHPLQITIRFFFCCTKTTMSVSLISPRPPPPTDILPVPACLYQS